MILATLQSRQTVQSRLAGLGHGGLRPLKASIRAAVCGFVAGAVFWHCVGFWSFVSQVAFANPDKIHMRRHEPGTAPPGNRIETGSIGTGPIEAGSIETGSINRRIAPPRTAKPAGGCTAVSVDAATSKTIQAECVKLPRPMRERASGRTIRQPVGQTSISAALEAQNSQLTDWPMPPIRP